MNKLSKVIICLLGFLTFSASLYAQDAKLTVKVTNVPLVEVIDQIEKECGCFFIYSKSLLDEQKIVSLNVEEVSLAEALNNLFSDTDLEWKVKKNHILLSKKEEPVSSPSKSATRVLSGVITEAATELPVPGATIFVDGTSTGTISDVNGRFSLEVTDGSMIKVTCLGFMDETFVCNSYTNNVTVGLKEDVNLINEVVVVGYGTVSKKNMTTAIVSVKTDDVQKAANSNLNSLLMGRAPGLQATVNSGQPDGKVNISIRGGGTPIYIVDGVVMPAGAISMSSSNINMPSNINRSGMGSINPSDIESIEVLKDASAAIYGVRAADGVILITTKQGQNGKPKVTYDGSYSFVKNYPYLQILNAREFMVFANVMNKETYMYNNSMYPYGSAVYDGRWTPVFTEDEIEDASTTDWTRFVLKDGSIHNHNLSVSGGTKHVKYYLSGQFYEQDGTVVNSGMNKITLHANINAQVLKFWNITATANVNKNNYLNSNTGADTGNRGALAASSLYAALILPPQIPEKQTDGSYTIYSNIPNPSSMAEISDRTTENGYNFNVSTTINLWKDYLKLKGMYGMNQENSLRTSYIPSTVYFDLVKKSRGNVSSQNRCNQTAEATLSFSKSFADIVTVDALLGMGIYNEDYYGYSVDYEGTIDVIRENDISSATGSILPNSYRGESEHRSQFLKASADILDRYVVAFTLRRDGSDKFFEGQKYNLFPSVSFAWKISNENFLKNVSWLNLLKIRGSWGITGSDNLGSSLYGTYSATEFRTSFGENAIQYTPYALNATNATWVSWQKTHMKNIGIDFFVLNNRLSGSIDVFRNDVTRLLGTDATAALAMFETKKVNYGHYYRQGWEFNLNSVNIDRAFKWETSLAVSRVNSIWLERQDNYAYKTYQIREKEPLNAWYYYKVAGIVNTDRTNVPDSQYTISSNATLPGMPIIDDKNGDGQITIDDIYMKNNVPTAYVGLGNTFSYKNFSLDIYCYGQFGLYKDNVVLSTTSGSWLSDASRNSSVLAYKIWNSQTNPEGTRPGIASSNLGALPGSCGTDVNMEDASFLKVRNITFGYTFDEKTLGRLGEWVKGIHLYFDAQNPLTFTRYTGFDPEMYMGGGGEGGKSLGEYPASRTFSLGARLSF